MVMKAYVRQQATSGTVALMDVPVPEIDDHEVLVEVRAFGVGVHDRYFIPSTATFPYPIGTEASGVIVATGGKVAEFEVGDAVALTSLLSPKGGPWAQFVVVPERSLMRLLEKLSFVEGAAIPVAGGAALESMKALDLKSGDALFIAGASGAIGTLVIQLAVARGIRVVGSASSKNHDDMQSLGAEMAVDYADPDWKKHVKQWMPGGMDAALAIQPGTGQDSVDVVKDGGKVVTVSGDSDRVVPERSITVQQMMHYEETRQDLIRLMSDIAAGRVRLVIERVYPFEQALDALRKTETRHARGKLVVSVEHKE
jgi:NADPH:quinone reductase-like Zn-dependent oxidoreductase